MPLTPQEVASKVFGPTRMRRGYDENEVDAFLDAGRGRAHPAQRRRTIAFAPGARQLARPGDRPLTHRQLPSGAAATRRKQRQVGCRWLRRSLPSRRPPPRSRRSAPADAPSSSRSPACSCWPSRPPTRQCSEAQIDADRTRGAARVEAERVLSEARARAAEEIGAHGAQQGVRSRLRSSSCRPSSASTASGCVPTWRCSSVSSTVRACQHPPWKAAMRMCSTSPTQVSRRPSPRPSSATASPTTPSHTKAGRATARLTASDPDRQLTPANRSTPTPWRVDYLTPRASAPSGHPRAATPSRGWNRSSAGLVIPKVRAATPAIPSTSAADWQVAGSAPSPDRCSASPAQ